MSLEEKYIRSEYLYKGKYSNVRIDTVKLPNEKITTREIIERPSAVCVVALTRENEILLVKQYRCPFKSVLLEVPAGKIDKNEEPEDAIKRELKEETGAVGMNYKSLGKLYMTPGFCDEIIYLYMCEIEKIEKTQPDEDEFLEIVKIPFETAISMVLRGEINDAKTSAIIMKAKLALEI